MGNTYTKMQEKESWRDVVLNENDMDMRTDKDPAHLDETWEKIMKEHKRDMVEKHGSAKRVRAIKLTADGFMSLEYINLITSVFSIKPEMSHFKCERCGEQYGKSGSYGRGIKGSGSTSYHVHIKSSECGCDLPVNEFLKDGRTFASYNLKCHVYFMKMNSPLISINSTGTEVDCTLEDMQKLKDSIKEWIHLDKRDWYGNYTFPESGALW